MTVRLDDMEFFARHGCLEQERRDGNTFRVDISYDYDMTLAAETDDVTHVVDYARVYEVVKNEMEKPSNLLENVAYRILNELRGAFPQINSATVTVSKFNPPVGGKVASSSVTMSF